MSLTYYSPAKINLFFKVISKREDGYHDIASLYQAISLADLLCIKKAKKDIFFCFNNHELKWDENNLVYKAVQFFRKKTAIDNPVEIYLKKNIPLEAGLAGGSSNAATTLWALNEEFNRPLSINDLIDLSKNLGADVSFFFSSGRAFCSGIGNVFEDCASYQNTNFYIAKPHFGMSTKRVYENLDLKVLTNQNVEALKHELFTENKFSYFNDLEKSAFQLDDRLIKTKNLLLNMGFDSVIMTGSGSSFICLGNIKPLKTKKIKFFPVFNVQRNQNNWYSF